MRTWLPLALLLAASCAPTPERPPVAENTRPLERADEAFLRREFAQAAHSYDAYLRENPRTTRRASVLLQIAKCRMGEERWDEAIRLLDDALRVAPDETVRLESHYRRALARNALWDTAGALIDLLILDAAPSAARGRAVREDEFRFRLGVTRIRAGDWPRGRADLSLVEASSPLADDAHLRRSLERFAVQIARGTDESTARRKVAEAAAKGVKARVHGAGHLVLVGAFDRFEDARVEADRLRALGFDGAFVLP